MIGYQSYFYIAEDQRLMGYTQELMVACRLVTEFLLLDNLSLSCMVRRECKKLNFQRKNNENK